MVVCCGSRNQRSSRVHRARDKNPSAISRYLQLALNYSLLLVFVVIPGFILTVIVLQSLDVVEGDPRREIEKIKRAVDATGVALHHWASVSEVLLGPSYIVVSFIVRNFIFYGKYVVQYTRVALYYAAFALSHVVTFSATELRSADPITLLLVAGSIVALVLMVMLKNYIVKGRYIQRAQDRVARVKQGYHRMVSGMILKIKNFSPMMAKLVPHLIVIVPTSVLMSYVTYVPQSILETIRLVLPLISTLDCISHRDAASKSFWLKYWVVYGLLIFLHVYLLQAFQEKHSTAVIKCYVVYYVWLRAPLTEGVELMFFVIRRSFFSMIQVAPSSVPSSSSSSSLSSPPPVAAVSGAQHLAAPVTPGPVAPGPGELPPPYVPDMGGPINAEQSNLLLSFMVGLGIVSQAQKERLAEIVTGSWVPLMALCFLFTPGFLTQLGTLLLGVAYPMQVSTQIVCQPPSRTTLVQTFEWLTYWVVFVLFHHMHEFLSYVGCSILPLWYHGRLLLTFWLLLPYFKGYHVVYVRFLSKLARFASSFVEGTNNIVAALSTRKTSRTRARVSREEQKKED